MEITFQSASQEVCTNILITEDGILESQEDFSVILSSSDRAVVTTSSTSTVTIINDDRKLEVLLVSIRPHLATYLQQEWRLESN